MGQAEYAGRLNVAIADSFPSFSGFSRQAHIVFKDSWQSWLSGAPTFHREDLRMRVAVTLLSLGYAASAACSAQGSAAPEPVQTLVRETVYNELHDHDQHGFWRYWILQHMQGGSQLSEQVETTDGPVARVVLNNGQPLCAQDKQVEQQKLEHLLNSPQERANRRQSYAEDEKRIARILAPLADAFLLQDAGQENGLRHVLFRPNPNYSAHSTEARVFRAMSGELWIDQRFKRLTRIEGHLESNVDFGFGVLGRVNKGGWFRLERTQVSPKEWKTNRLEVHLSGRALLLKTIAKETSEVRGGFAAVPDNINLVQGLHLLEQSTGTDGRRPAEVAAISLKH